MRLRTLATLGLVLTIALAGAACEAPTNQAGEPEPAPANREEGMQAIRALIDSAEAAINSRDFGSFAMQFEPNADAIMFDGPRVQGADAIRAAMEAAWTAQPDDRMISLAIDDVRFVADDVAIVNSTATYTTGEPSTNRSTGVIVRQADGSWKTVALRLFAAAGQ